MLVLDTSVALEVLLKTPLGVRCFERVLGGGEDLHAPHLIDVEFAQVLRRLTRSAALSSDLAQQALDDLRDLALERHPHTLLLPRIWQLRDSVSAYDAAYIALAEGLDAPLATCDTRLSRSHGHRASIELLR